MANGNGSVAPVCPTSRSQFPAAQPGITIPPVPRASDLPSAIAAVNQLIQIVNWMMNPPVVNNALTINNLQMPKPRWSEISRTVQPVRIYNPNDKSQWVDVERITKVSWQDAVTRGLLNWNYVNKALMPTLPSTPTSLTVPPAIPGTPPTTPPTGP